MSVTNRAAGVGLLLSLSEVQPVRHRLFLFSVFHSHSYTSLSQPFLPIHTVMRVMQHEKEAKACCLHYSSITRAPKG